MIIGRTFKGVKARHRLHRVAATDPDSGLGTWPPDASDAFAALRRPCCAAATRGKMHLRRLSDDGRCGWGDLRDSQQSLPRSGYPTTRGETAPPRVRSPAVHFWTDGCRARRTAPGRRRVMSHAPAPSGGHVPGRYEEPARSARHADGQHSGSDGTACIPEAGSWTVSIISLVMRCPASGRRRTSAPAWSVRCTWL